MERETDDDDKTKRRGSRAKKKSRKQCIHCDMEVVIIRQKQEGVDY